MASTGESYRKEQDLKRKTDQSSALKRLATALQYSRLNLDQPDLGSYIVPGIDNLPLDLPNFDDSTWKILSCEDIGFIKDFYSQQVPIQCRIRDCNAVPVGFREVLVHQHVHGRRYTHLCAAHNCYVPFDKLGNAKRHVATYVLIVLIFYLSVTI